MNRMLYVVLCLAGLCFMLSAAPIGASVWDGGYSIGLDGYVAPQFSEGEYLSATIHWDPFSFSFLRPMAHAGLLIPLAGVDLDPPRLTLGLGFFLITIQDHPLDRFLRRDSAITPKIEATAVFSAMGWDVEALALLFQPLTIFFGDKHIGVLGVQAVRQLGQQEWGWGVRLFEISQYLW